MDPEKPPGTFQIRPAVYQVYLNQVERLGVKIQFNKRVVEYFDDEERGKAGVVTDQGERFEADVVIAADGIGSKCQKIIGGQVRAVSSGRAMWRAAFPRHHIDKNEEVAEFYKMMGPHGINPCVKTWLGPGTYAMTMVNDTTAIWIMNHDTTVSAEESWNNTIEVDEVLANMDKSVPSPWGRMLKELVKLTPPRTVVNFELFWRNPQPSWSSPGGRVVVIGDAAHSFLPASGNGATQAIEDAVSIAACLQLAGADLPTTDSQAERRKRVPLAVRTHVRFRFVRCACAQKLGFANAELLQKTDWDQVKVNPRLAQPKLPSWIWRHDVEPYTIAHFARVAASVERGESSDQTFGESGGVPPNYPPGYVYEPWDIDDIIKDLYSGKPVEMGPGNWD
ncbi:hypothetical protein GGR56DRAFT_628274 [Xylariaceae sp. FL0804]|nr:hypothetical protein GGR56DRAFT_628274 [Xylariaceae sp. FL0804]